MHLWFLLLLLEIVLVVVVARRARAPARGRSAAGAGPSGSARCSPPRADAARGAPSRAGAARQGDRSWGSSSRTPSCRCPARRSATAAPSWWAGSARRAGRLSPAPSGHLEAHLVLALRSPGRALLIAMPLPLCRGGACAGGLGVGARSDGAVRPGAAPGAARRALSRRRLLLGVPVALPAAAARGGAAGGHAVAVAAGGAPRARRRDGGAAAELRPPRAGHLGGALAERAPAPERAAQPFTPPAAAKPCPRFRPRNRYSTTTGSE